MIRKSAIVTTTLLLLLLAVPLSWAQERAIRPLETNKKQALVIGNGNYAHAGVLRNPANDAKAIGKTLQQLGFKVTTVTDGDKRQMDQAIRKFGMDLRGSNGVGLFFYAGHGMQIDGENYLLPTDINPSNEFDVAYDAVPVGKLLGQMQVAENGMNIVILDACRNNPFARSFRSSSRGLAQVIAPTGSFISYATAPGNVAADGEGDNGLFTEKLLQHMTTPGLKLEEVFKRVRADVQQDSNNKQVPWDSSSVTGDFFFVPMAEVAPVVPAVISSGTIPEQDFATQAWELIKDTEDPKAFETFIQMFPEAPQANLAKLKLITLAPKEPKVDSSVSQVESPIPETPKVNLAVPKNTEALSGEAAIKKLLATQECVRCNLREANLARVLLEKANLRGANLEKANLRGANLEKANLRGANLEKAILIGTNLRDTNLLEANTKGTSFYNTRFCNTKMPDGSINNQNCEKPVQVEPTVEVLSGKAAMKKLLATQECVRCNFQRANLSGAQLLGAQLLQAHLLGADLREANLTGANLSGANLSGTDLRKADLRKADLTETSLVGADLREANLTGANLSNSKLAAARFCKTVMPDGSQNNKNCKLYN